MDGVVGLEGVEALALVEVPEHGNAVLAARGAQGAVGGDGDCAGRGSVDERGEGRATNAGRVAGGVGGWPAVFGGVAAMRWAQTHPC